MIFLISNRICDALIGCDLLEKIVLYLVRVRMNYLKLSYGEKVLTNIDSKIKIEYMKCHFSNTKFEHIIRLNRL